MCLAGRCRTGRAVLCPELGLAEKGNTDDNLWPRAAERPMQWPKWGVGGRQRPASTRPPRTAGRPAGALPQYGASASRRAEAGTGVLEEVVEASTAATPGGRQQGAQAPGIWGQEAGAAQRAKLCSLREAGELASSLGRRRYLSRTSPGGAAPSGPHLLSRAHRSPSQGPSGHHPGMVLRGQLGWQGGHHRDQPSNQPQCSGTPGPASHILNAGSTLCVHATVQPVQLLQAHQQACRPPAPPVKRPMSTSASTSTPGCLWAVATAAPPALPEAACARLQAPTSHQHGPGHSLGVLRGRPQQAPWGQRCRRAGIAVPASALQARPDAPSVPGLCPWTAPPPEGPCSDTQVGRVAQRPSPSRCPHL